MKKEVDELVTNAIRDFGKMIDIVKNAFGDSLPKSTTIDLVKNSIEGDVGELIGIAKSVLGGDVDVGAIINLVSTVIGGDEDVGTIIDIVTGAVGGNATEDVSGLDYLNVPPVEGSATEDVSDSGTETPLDGDKLIGETQSQDSVTDTGKLSSNLDRKYKVLTTDEERIKWLDRYLAANEIFLTSKLKYGPRSGNLKERDELLLERNRVLSGTSSYQQDGRAATAPGTSVPPAMGSGLVGSDASAPVGSDASAPVGSDAMGSGLDSLNVPEPDAMGSGLDFWSVRDDRLSGADRPNDQAKKSGDASTVIDLVSAYARDSGAVGLFSAIGGIILGDKEKFVEETKNLGTLGSNIKAMLNAAGSFLAGDPRPVLAALPTEVQATMALVRSPDAFISNYIVGTGNRLVNLILADPEAVKRGAEGFTVDGFISAIAEPYIEEGKTILGAGERLIAAIKNIPGGQSVVDDFTKLGADLGAKLQTVESKVRTWGEEVIKDLFPWASAPDPDPPVSTWKNPDVSDNSDIDDVR